MLRFSISDCLLLQGLTIEGLWLLLLQAWNNPFLSFPGFPHSQSITAYIPAHWLRLTQIPSKLWLRKLCHDSQYSSCFEWNDDRSLWYFYGNRLWPKSYPAHCYESNPGHSLFYKQPLGFWAILSKLLYFFPFRPNLLFLLTFLFSSDQLSYSG